ncbi:MAG TPA: ZIP family metal transporter, partial [Planctomycetota bacterium]|nr:ZIP family metal transporter [Planctomycetota bacterium]
MSAATSFTDALVHSLLAGGVGTGIGALPVMLVRRIGLRLESALAGFSAGVMLAASFVALLLPAFELARHAGGSAATWPVLVGVAFGGAAIAVAHRWMPHEHFVRRRVHHGPTSLSRVWLLTIALALHNVPEGFAVGVAVASGDAQIGWPVTASIGAQNVPEGLIVAVAFVAAGYRKRTAFLVTL